MLVVVDIVDAFKYGKLSGMLRKQGVELAHMQL